MEGISEDKKVGGTFQQCVHAEPQEKKAFFLGFFGSFGGLGMTYRSNGSRRNLHFVQKIQAGQVQGRGLAPIAQGWGTGYRSSIVVTGGG